MCRAVLGMALWTLLSLPAFVCAEELTAAGILQDFKVAAGGMAWDEVRVIRSTSKLRTAGLEGSLETLEDVLTGRYVSRYQLNAITGAEGFDGEQAWSQDPSGDVTPTDARNQMENAHNLAWLAARAYWYPERHDAEMHYQRTVEEADARFHVISAAPAGGRQMELWFDTETHLLNRIVDLHAEEVQTTFYSDYQKVGELLLPCRYRTTTGDPKYDSLIATESTAINPELEPGAFPMPETKLADFFIAGDADHTVLPFALLNNHIYVQVHINDRAAMPFLVDTGGLNLLTRQAAETLDVQAEGAFEGRGAGEESVDVGVAEVESVRFGEATLHDQVFYVLPLDEVKDVEGVEFGGLIGFEVFRRFTARIDYENHLLTLYRPESFHYEEHPGLVRIPFRYDERTPVIDAILDGREGVFTVDTGARSSLSMHTWFVKRHDLVDFYDPPVETVTGWGVGGPVRGHVARAGRFELGGIKILQPLVNLSQQKSGAFADRYVAGNIGGGILKRFTVIFDYRKQVMLLERNGLFDMPDPYDCSGLWLNSSDGALVIAAVVDSSPAQAAGLQVEDRVVAVNGQPVGDLRLPDLRERLRCTEPGAQITFTVDEQDGQRDHLVTLRELVPSKPVRNTDSTAPGQQQ